ncbi:hypothetical protein D1O30_18825 [Methylocystis hirsuta]|uniref:Uncharacterized protein n=1 Tax=Methylocystis hirsuta TaxID=369798 RepID=A0A3M9XSR8_9HYPH|nr:hypothetical protein D1O30_18825 [Methylocystis hirsuta]
MILAINAEQLYILFMKTETEKNYPFGISYRGFNAGKHLCICNLLCVCLQKIYTGRAGMTERNCSGLICMAA